jgi:hypothetical protein
MLVLIEGLVGPRAGKRLFRKKTLAPTGNQTKIRPVYSLGTTSTTFSWFVHKYQCADYINEKEGAWITLGDMRS